MIASLVLLFIAISATIFSYGMAAIAEEGVDHISGDKNRYMKMTEEVASPYREQRERTFLDPVNDKEDQEKIEEIHAGRITKETVKEVSVASACSQETKASSTATAPSRSKSPLRNYREITAVVTAYAPFDNQSGICNDGDPTNTSTGTYPQHGTIAADPARIPYGTKVYIPGYGYGTIEDTGGALRNDKNNIRLDVFVDTYAEAMAFGRKTMTVRIYD